MDSQISAPVASLLIVIGEPFTDKHRDLICQQITQGLKTWDIERTGVDINGELAALTQAAPVGEDSDSGEKVIQHTSERLATTILINPSLHAFKSSCRSFLASPSSHRHLVFGGHIIQGSGEWVLQDDCLTFLAFTDLIRHAEGSLSQGVKGEASPSGGCLTLHTLAEGEWTAPHFDKPPYNKISFQFNPVENPALAANGAGIEQFSAYLSPSIQARSLEDLHQSSNVVGNIRFSRPTLYIFPGYQGDSALFGISGFNLLVNGGYGRKAVFWDLTRHLDRIDAVLMTHLGADNVFGFGSVLEKKVSSTAHPEIGFTYFNTLDKAKGATNGVSTNGGQQDASASLLVNLVEEGNKLVHNLKQLGQPPRP